MKQVTAMNRIRELEEKHGSLAQEVKSLTRRAYLTPTEQQQVAELKKRKLSAKDELHELRRDLSL